MWQFIVDLIQQHSDYSSKRFLLLAFLSVATVMWVIMCFKAGKLVDIPWGPVAIIGALIGGVASDHFGNGNSLPSSRDVTTTMTREGDITVTSKKD